MSPNRFTAAGLSSRVITGLALAALLITVWLMGGWMVFLLLAVIVALGLWEFYTMVMPAISLPLKLGGCIMGILYLLICQAAPTYPPAHILAAFTLGLALYCLIVWHKEDGFNVFGRGTTILSGLVYIPLLLAPAMGFLPVEQALIVMVPALSDVTAYFAGVSLGKHKIWPEVSPKKSMEGAISGLAASVVVTCIFGLGWGIAPFWTFVLLGLGMGIMSQLGDFFESALKRTADIKDSGTLLPGHGGILDRIDSILFACGTYAVASAWYPFF